MTATENSLVNFYRKSLVACKRKDLTDIRMPVSHTGSDVPRITQQEARGQDSAQVGLAVKSVSLDLLAGVAAPAG